MRHRKSASHRNPGPGDNMADKEEEQSTEGAGKSSPVITIAIGAFSAIALGSAAAGATYLLAPGATNCLPAEKATPNKAAPQMNTADVVFVNLDPLVVTLGPGAKSRYLKISLTLETSKDYEKSLKDLTPRIRDTLNAYLRAVEEDDLIRPAGMSRLRAQMLRRLHLVTPPDQVQDVLITDFVLT